MAFVIKDRIQETSVTTGVGTLSLDGADEGYQSWAAIGDTNVSYYMARHRVLDEWEVGIGTYASPGLLSRDTIIDSSNSGQPVFFSTGIKDVICTQPASKAVLMDSDGNIHLAPSNRITAGDGGTTDYIAISPAGLASFNGAARIDWTKYSADSATLAVGTSSSVVADLQTAHDGNTYDISEVTGTPGIDLIVDFVSVPAFQWVSVLGYYDGTATHAVSVQLYNWVTTSWDTWDSLQTAVVKSNHSLFITTPANYVGTGANAGEVRVRLIHTMAGNASHDAFIDEVALYQ